MSAKTHGQSQKMGVFLQGIGNTLIDENAEIPLMPQKLTDTAVKMAKPKEKPWKLTDGGELYVLVSPTGGSSGVSSIVSEERKNALPWAFILSSRSRMPARAPLPQKSCSHAA